MFFGIIWVTLTQLPCSGIACRHGVPRLWMLHSMALAALSAANFLRVRHHTSLYFANISAPSFIPYRIGLLILAFSYLPGCTI